MKTGNIFSRLAFAVDEFSNSGKRYIKKTVFPNKKTVFYHRGITIMGSEFTFENKLEPFIY